MRGLLCLMFLLAAVAAGAGAVVGDRAPEFRLKDLSGRTRSLGELRQERALLLDFGSVFCTSCQETLRRLAALREDLNRRSVAVAIVNVDSAKAAPAVRSVAKGLGVRFPVLLDAGGVAARDYGVKQIPSLVLIDGRGVIRAVHTGPVDGGELRRMLERVSGTVGGGK